jgi:hypothetical protein
MHNKKFQSDVGSERGGRNAIKNDSLSVTIILMIFYYFLIYFQDFRHEQDVLAGLEPQASSHFVLSRERRQSNDSKDSGERHANPED